MTFKPNKNWILIPDPTKTETDSGIILDETTAKSQATNILKVHSVGPECEFVKAGDTVMIDPRTEAVRAPIEDTTYLLIQEFQVLGKF